MTSQSDSIFLDDPSRNPGHRSPHESVSASHPAPSPANPSAVVIEVDQVSKHFDLSAEPANTIKERLLSLRRRSRSSGGGRFPALTDISFQVHEGETFGILGHNGSGKSTLLKLIAGTVPSSSGRIRTRGRLSALLELGAGFHPDLTGRENIYLNASILGIPKIRVDEIFEDVVRFAELGDFIDLQVKHYSSGMQGRLGFAVASDLDPDVLLVDEVLAVGDEAFQAKCMERIHTFRQRGHTMVLVSHSTEQMRQLCDRVAVLERGHLLFVGDPDEAIDLYRSALHGANAGLAGRVVEVEATVEVPEELPPVAVTGCRLLGLPEDGVLAPGDSVTVGLSFTVSEPIEHNIRLVVATLDGNVMMSRSIFDTLGKSLPGELGDNEVWFELGPIPLLDGRYQITVLAESLATAEVHHRVANIAEFDIDGPGHGFGRVAIPVSCEVRNDPRRVSVGADPGQ